MRPQSLNHFLILGVYAQDLTIVKRKTSHTGLVLSKLNKLKVGYTASAKSSSVQKRS